MAFVGHAAIFRIREDGFIRGNSVSGLGFLEAVGNRLNEFVAGHDIECISNFFW